MDLTTYHQMRTAMQSNASPGSASEVALLEELLQRTLLSTELFEEVEVGHTDDPDHLVIAMCKFHPYVDHQKVALRLEGLWQNRIRYGFWEAHATIADPDQVEFQGATRTSTTGHYVTVHVLAQKARVPAQRLAPVSRDRVLP